MQGAPTAEPAAPQEPDLVITVDAHDVITSVSQNWDDVAEGAGGASCVGGALIGTAFLDHIRDNPTRRAMAILLASARRVCRPMTLDYRCDGPDTKRFMAMTITAAPDGSAEMRHRLLREQRRPIKIKTTSVLDGVPAGADRDLIKRCSLCNRCYERGGWVEVLDGLETRALRVIHTVCPDCRERVRNFRYSGSANQASMR